MTNKNRENVKYYLLIFEILDKKVKVFRGLHPKIYLTNTKVYKNLKEYFLLF